MSMIVDTYKKIFELVPETCEIIGVRRISESKNDIGKKATKFIALLEAPIDCDDFEPERMECDKLKKIATKVKNLGGITIINMIDIEVRGKKKKYSYSIELLPENILYFKVKDGMMNIECFCYGIFY